jgi:hypothetical protein
MSKPGCPSQWPSSLVDELNQIDQELTRFAESRRYIRCFRIAKSGEEFVFNDGRPDAMSSNCMVITSEDSAQYCDKSEFTDQCCEEVRKNYTAPLALKSSLKKNHQDFPVCGIMGSTKTALNPRRVRFAGDRAPNSHFYPSRRFISMQLIRADTNYPNP